MAVVGRSCCHCPVTLAVVLAGVTVADVLDQSPTPSASLGYVTGEKPTLNATVLAGSLRAGEDVETSVRGCKIRAEAKCPDDAELVAVDRSKADSSGKAEVKLSVSPVSQAFDGFVLLVAAGSHRVERTIDIR